MLDTTDTDTDVVGHIPYPTAKARPYINAIDVTQMSRVLRKLLLDHNIKPYDLAEALNLPNKVINQLLHNQYNYPKLCTLLPIAKFFKITIGQLIGDEPLNSYSATEDDSPTISNNDLSMQCTTLAIQLFKKHNVAFNEKLAVKLIFDIYHYSSCINNGTLNKDFADWYVAQHANKQMV